MPLSTIRKPKINKHLILAVCVIILLILAILTIFMVTNRVNANHTKMSTVQKSPRPPVAETITMFGTEINIDPNIPASPYSIKNFAVSEDDVVTYMGDGAVYGIDVSTFQGDIDWKKVKDSGVDFAIIRLGFRGMSEGQLYLDDCFLANIEGAISAGVDVGIYFFSQAISVEEAREEAEFVLENLNGTKLQYPIFFDWEPGNTPEDRTNSIYSSPIINDFALEFCRVVKDAGYNAGIYYNSYQGYFQYNLSLYEDTCLWLAEYDTETDFYYAFNIWQYSYTSTVDGIDYPVDFNICFTLEHLN